MQKEEAASQNKQPKPRKKKGKIETVYELHQKGCTVEDICKKTGLKPSIARSYIWRRSNPTKYADLLARYQQKRKEKLKQKESAKEAEENKAEKA